MSNTEDSHTSVSNVGPNRRDVLRATGAMTVASLLSPLTASAHIAPGADVAAFATSGERDQLPLGQRIQGFQHFGMTVQNMDRAYEFYTEVLGGTEVMRDGDFHGDKIQNTLFLNDEIEAHERKISPATIGVPDLRGGSQRLDVRFIQFDNMVVELLHYRDSAEDEGKGAAWAPPHELRSPAYPRSLHLCFHLRDDIDFNKFVHDLEAEAQRRGMTNVSINRIVTARTDAERRSAPLEANSNKITEGKSNGWALIYARGPEGEALEFVQALGPVKQVFDHASEQRRKKAKA